jgi:murein DD-endopeptidase MepM/ murein hydrolase activator NlpD
MQNLMTTGLVPPGSELLNRATAGLEKSLRAAQAQSAGSRSAELRKAAQEFESIFVAYLFKVMRETIDEASGPESSGFGKAIYTELFDQEVSRTIASRGVLGIADLMMKRLDVAQAHSDDGGAETTPPSAVPGSPSSQPAPPHIGTPDEIPETMMPISAPVSSGFGLRRDPFTRQLKFHRGMDLAAPVGTPVQAVADGEVTFAGYQRGFGNTVVIRHGDGLESRYAHLGQLSVRLGETVRAQTNLGEVGKSGRSTGPHLHFEVTQWGMVVDPRESLSE